MRLRLVWHVECVGEWKNVYRVLVGKPEERGHLENLGIDGMLMLLNKSDGRVWTGFIWIRIGLNGGQLQT
jgi:hypothetical protein